MQAKTPAGRGGRGPSRTRSTTTPQGRRCAPSSPFSPTSRSTRRSHARRAHSVHQDGPDQADAARKVRPRQRAEDHPRRARAIKKRLMKDVFRVRQERHPHRSGGGVRLPACKSLKKCQEKTTLPKNAKRLRLHLPIPACPTWRWQIFRGAAGRIPRLGRPNNSAAPEGLRSNEAALDRPPLGALQKKPT